MIPEKLTTRHFRPMGIEGAYERKTSTVLLSIGQWEFADGMAATGTILERGDKVTLMTAATVSPRQACLGCVVNPALGLSGMVSCPSYIGEDFFGHIVVHFEAWKTIDIGDLAYLVRLFPIGKLVIGKGETNE